MITQQDSNKIVDILRNIGNQVAGDSLSRALLLALFTSLFLAQFKDILPGAVTLPEDAVKMIRDKETIKKMLTQI